MAKRNLMFSTPEEIRRSLAKVANMTYKGELDTKTANSIILACNAMLSGIRTDEQGKKLIELEQLLNEVEDKT